jgi:hypothetical protein
MDFDVVFDKSRIGLPERSRLRLKSAKLILASVAKVTEVSNFTFIFPFFVFLLHALYHFFEFATPPKARLVGRYARQQHTIAHR